MDFKLFSKNGNVLPIAEAVVPLDNIEYQYGFGVYETVRVSKGFPRFLADHTERLMESARIIGLEHSFDPAFVVTAVESLLKKIATEALNLKILLIGARSKEGATLYVFPLNPLFPEKRLYSEGAALVTYEHERPFPHAKALSMLTSYLAYRRASTADCYDALLVDRDGNVTEGTRTNFLCLKGRTVISPPASKILLGVTRKHLLDVAKKGGFSYEERDIPLALVPSFDSAFLTSTSSKIVPIRSIDGAPLPPASEALRELMRLFDTYLSEY